VSALMPKASSRPMVAATCSVSTAQCTSVPETPVSWTPGQAATVSAGTGRVVTANGALNAPLGLTLAPAGHLLAVNADDGRIVEVTPAGAQVASRFLDRSGSPPGAGALFGLALTPGGNGVYYVDDATNELRLLH